MKKSPSDLLISSEDHYVLFDLHKLTLLDTLLTKKKSSLALPSLLDVSYDDLYSLEAVSQMVLLRNLKSRQVLAKYEGHLYPVAHLAFAPASYLFVTAANSECLLWNA